MSAPSWRAGLPKEPKAHAGDGESTGPGIDCDALLCALVLAPSTYSRNRFFHLYQDQEIRLVRRRAARLRSLVRQCVKASVDPCVVKQAAGDFEVQLKAPNLGYERRTSLCELELCLFRYLHAKSLGRAADAERRTIEASLAKLLPHGLPGGS